ncbi:transmembrane protein 42 isoform X1 [Austrofundulus limnaeus]|uniref:Transmembrane protein 42 isoform X1 n=1 Tax=Austrofundulus limnaeus TaxID=52670 RepID=A0A2I4D758_AUSLI|nr:PREDICTED: transmembrane protein 42 isoform X1 [Austrofundulus limnaeus]
MRASLDLREATQTPPTRLCQPGNKSCVVVSEMVSGSVYALLAGFLAAAASLSAKLTVGADYLRDMCESGLSRWDEARDGSTVCDWLHVPLRLLCAGLLFSCNAVMWTLFSKALRHCSSSARATVTTTASNFISSGILGRFMFGETHSSLWWTGMSLTLCGLLVLHASTPQSPTQEGGQKDK